jgi:prepilin-type N-terminal cleavage/methylation domain-containing protein
MMRPGRRREAPTGESGYTLVELIVVISVLGILAATMGPRFFDQQVFSQRGYADELASALRATQKAAVITGCAAQLTLTAGAYAANQQVASGNACNAASSTYSTPVLGADGSAIAGTAPSGTTVTPTGTFSFDTQGRLASSPGTTLTVGARTITIVAGTGFVQVQ